MKKDCFGGPGQWYKGNLHSHTTNSDGHLTPAQAAAVPPVRLQLFVPERARLLH